MVSFVLGVKVWSRKKMLKRQHFVCE